MMSNNKPTQEQFEDYISIRNSGVTNMFDVRMVCSLSTTGLTRDNCMYIMQNFEKLLNEYEVDI